MITLKINGLDVSVEQGTTVLEAATFLGFPIPNRKRSWFHPAHIRHKKV